MKWRLARKQVVNFNTGSNHRVHTFANAKMWWPITKSDPGFKSRFPDWSGSECPLARWQNVVHSFQSFRRVSWKTAGDCTRNADKYPKMSHSAVEKWRESVSGTGPCCEFTVESKNFQKLPTLLAVMNAYRVARFYRPGSIRAIYIIFFLNQGRTKWPQNCSLTSVSRSEDDVSWPRHIRPVTWS